MMFEVKKKNPYMVNPNETKIPIFQKTLQNLGFFLAILTIILFNFFVLNNARRGKNRVYAPFLFLRSSTKVITITQKINEIINHGFKINSDIKVKNGIVLYNTIIFTENNLSFKIKFII